MVKKGETKKTYRRRVSVLVTKQNKTQKKNQPAHKAAQQSPSGLPNRAINDRFISPPPFFEYK
jgi:hypothetical protein